MEINKSNFLKARNLISGALSGVQHTKNNIELSKHVMIEYIKKEADKEIKKKEEEIAIFKAQKELEIKKIRMRRNKIKLDIKSKVKLLLKQ